MKKKLIFALFGLTGLLVLILFAANFSTNAILCSPIAGRLITKDGQPVANITIIRTWQWDWNDQRGTDSVTTDSEGRFSFVQIEGHSLSASLLPHEPNIRQNLVAQMPSGQLNIWGAIKRRYELNTELDGKPTRIKCFADKEASDDGLYWGTCIEDR